MENLSNTRWLITGGTSGLGLALTQQLVQEGAKVAVVARSGQDLKRLEKNLQVIPIQGDLKSKEDIYKISAQALGQLGGLDFLVNNASQLAGGRLPLSLLLDTECENFEEVLQTNVLGPFRLIKALLPTMIFQKRGVVINISSDAAVNAYPTWGPYGVSKAGLDHLSHIWSKELEGKNIRFLSIDPGDMNTPMHALAVPGADPQSVKSPELSARQLLEILSKDKDVLWSRRSL